MTRLFTTGFEFGVNDLSNPGGGTAQNLGANARPNSGPYVMGGMGTVGCYQAIPGTETELYVRVAHRISNTASSQRLRLQNPTGNVLMALRWTGASVIDLYIGAGIVYSTVPTYFPLNSWHLLEIYYKLADAGGRVIVKYDGAVIIDYTGDTNPATYTAIGRLAFYDSSNNYGVWDDLAINTVAGAVDNSWCGDGRVFGLAANADGSFSQFMGSDGNQVSNYALINEMPPTMTTYVESAGAGNKDFYNFAALPTLAGGDVVRRVWVNTLAQRNNATVDQPAQLGLLSGGVEDFDASILLPTAPATLRTKEWLLDPNGSVPWTEAAVAALQAGVKVS